MRTAVKKPETYRITTWGDGAGVSTVQGWEQMVAAVADLMYFEPTPQEVEDVREMIEEGIDSDEGWDGKQVHLQFEDGSLQVELMD